MVTLGNLDAATGNYPGGQFQAPPVVVTPTPIPAIPDPANLLGQLDALTGAYPGGQYAPSGTTGGATVVNISAGVIASPTEFALLVQNAVQANNRAGNNLNYAGAI